MLSQSSHSHALAILAGIATGALVGIGLGIALFVYEAKHDMEASYGHVLHLARRPPTAHPGTSST